MSTIKSLQELGAAAERELRTDILPFWAERTIDRERGGFYGLITNDLDVDETAPKGLVLNARILWAFSAASRAYPDRSNGEVRDRAYGYLIDHFWDTERSGLVWMVNPGGTFLDTRKQIYGQAFGVYALAEYFRATGDKEALERAIQLFEIVEEHAFEAPQGDELGGYVEALDRDWQPLEDMRLSSIDLNAPYSQNTHLHLLEAYTVLLRVWPEPAVRDRLRELWQILAFRIRNEQTNHLALFQDRDWKPLSDAISYGHDIEGSWLLYEAAEMLGDGDLIDQTREIALAMAETVLEKGFDREHGGVSDATGHHGPLAKEWWPQAEAVVGFLNAFELSRRDDFLDAALATWAFIDAYVVDRTYGEWYYRLSSEGRPELDLPKVSPWKGPYHNVRAALEVIERTKRLSSGL
jgi:mannobiose 2-epimerase